MDNDDTPDHEINVTSGGSNDTTMINDDNHGNVIDASAVLFEDGNDDTNDEVFSTQTQRNIELMAVNFMTPPSTKTTPVENNFKFRKREHLK